MCIRDRYWCSGSYSGYPYYHNDGNCLRYSGNGPYCKLYRFSQGRDTETISKPYAYKLIRRLNDELEAQGFITIAGRVNRQYFHKRLYGEGKEIE